MINLFKRCHRLRNRSIRRRQEVLSPQAGREPQASTGITYDHGHGHSLEHCYCSLRVWTPKPGFLFLHEHPWDISVVPHGTLSSLSSLISQGTTWAWLDFHICLGMISHCKDARQQQKAAPARGGTQLPKAAENAPSHASNTCRRLQLPARVPSPGPPHRLPRLLLISDHPPCHHLTATTSRHPARASVHRRHQGVLKVKCCMVLFIYLFLNPTDTCKIVLQFLSGSHSIFSNL